MTDDWLRGYLLIGNGEIQGCNLSIPQLVVLEGVQQVASLGSTWRVMPKYRFASLLISQPVGYNQDSVLRFNGTPTTRVIKLIKGPFQCARETIDGSLLGANQFSIMLKLFGKSRGTLKLPRLIQSQPALEIHQIKELVDDLWLKMSQTTGPLRDWNYWKWISIDNPSVKCSTVVLHSKHDAGDTPLIALLVDFGDGKLQMTDVWPQNTSRRQAIDLINICLKYAKRGNFHTLLVPYFCNELASASQNFIQRKATKISADIWVNKSIAGDGCSVLNWPLHTGDALL